MTGFEWQRWVRTQAKRADVTPIMVLVLYALATYANADGVAWPSIATLAEDTGHRPDKNGGHRATSAALAKLEAAGLIRTTQRGRGRCAQRKLLAPQALSSATCRTATTSTDTTDTTSTSLTASSSIVELVRLALPEATGLDEEDERFRRAEAQWTPTPDPRAVRALRPPTCRCGGEPYSNEDGDLVCARCGRSSVRAAA